VSKKGLQDQTLGKFASAIKIAFTNVSAVDLKNWYIHCGYQGL